MKRLLLLALLAGCPTPTSGTIQLGLTTAPGSTLLESVTRLRVTLTNPRQVVEAVRGANGFHIALDVEANGEAGAIVVEGFDANDNLVAAGQSPEFGVAAINARIVVYMGIPLGIDRAPLSLTPPRAHSSGTPLTYGVLFAGGVDMATSAPSDGIAIYNAFDHSLAGGKAMPAGRDGIVLATGANNAVYLYGGRDANGTETSTYWGFDTNFQPDGAYADFGDHPGLPRADQTVLTIGVDTFVVTGAPPIDLQGMNVAEHANLAALAPTAASITSGGMRVGVTLDSLGNLLRFRNGAFDMLAAGARPGGSVGALPDGTFLVVGGGTADEQNDVLVVDPMTGVVIAKTDVLAVPRTGASVAITRRHVVIVGGGPVEILDAQTLASVGTRDPIDGQAWALPNDQVIIVDETGGLSLFTPPPPTL